MHFKIESQLYLGTDSNGDWWLYLHDRQHLFVAKKGDKAALRRLSDVADLAARREETPEPRREPSFDEKLNRLAKDWREALRMATDCVDKRWSVANDCHMEGLYVKSLALTEEAPPHRKRKALMLRDTICAERVSYYRAKELLAQYPGLLGAGGDDD